MPAAGHPRDPATASMSATAPIRMTQALTDDDGRVRDLLERPLAAGDYRLEFDVAREAGRSSRRSPSTCRSPTCAQLPRPAAARALFDDDLPGQLTEPPQRIRTERVDVDPRMAAGPDDDQLDRVRTARRPGAIEHDDARLGCGRVEVDDAEIGAIDPDLGLASRWPARRHDPERLAREWNVTLAPALVDERSRPADDPLARVDDQVP